MRDETKESHNEEEDLATYRPVTVRISDLIASQLNDSESDCPLQANAELISRYIGTAPKDIFEQDWKEIVENILLPGSRLVGIGACIDQKNVDAAVKEALRDPSGEMGKKQDIVNNNVLVGIFGGTDIQVKAVKRIESLVSYASCQDVDCKLVQYDEMQNIIAVLIMTKLLGGLI